MFDPEGSHSEGKSFTDALRLPRIPPLFPFFASKCLVLSGMLLNVEHFILFEQNNLSVYGVSSYLVRHSH